MKATGIVRRIDDLGRVVVPKEIRRTLRIREGDPLEIFTDREGEIILKKYSPIGELSLFAKQYAEAMAQTSGFVVAIADRDQFIAVAGSGKKDLLAKAVSRELENLMTEVASATYMLQQRLELLSYSGIAQKAAGKSEKMQACVFLLLELSLLRFWFVLHLSEYAFPFTRFFRIFRIRIA